MEKLKHKEHDFSSKLRQTSVVERLKQYIAWRRTARDGGTVPCYSPISINLDLTSACNFACPHCVDSKIINTGEALATDDIKQTIDCLQTHGLLSIILLGGGEPTLHKDFGEIVKHIKKRGLQLGIATNGSRLSQVADVIGELGHEDWVRLSLDAGCQDTFVKAHRPRTGITLHEILKSAQELKLRNPRFTLGYSFVIVWEGIRVNGRQLAPNIAEMADAVQLAREHAFDYVSFKPCLLRLEESEKESLFADPDDSQEQRVITAIKNNLQKARDTAAGEVKILESVNLRALLDYRVHELKKQPRTCHMQFFNTVVTPTGIFHCPAFRGVGKAKIAPAHGYRDEKIFNETLQTLARSLDTFDAEKECNVVACFYHHVNWWLERCIASDKQVESIETVADDNFFL